MGQKDRMTLLALIVVLALLGILAWGATYIPNAIIKKIAITVIIVVAVLLVLQAFGVWDEVRHIMVPRVGS